MKICKPLSFCIHQVFYPCMTRNSCNLLFASLLQNNLHGPFSKRRVFLVNFFVKMLPCLPTNGKRIRIVGSCSVGMLSAWPASACVVVLFISARDVENTSDITIYRKSTHTGQYTHLSSFTPWSRKTAWIRALVNRAYRICNNHQLLQAELKTIKQFMSWNGFSRNLTNKLIHVFTPRAEMNNKLTTPHTPTPAMPTAFPLNNYLQYGCVYHLLANMATF